jgi:hypothetical protein
MKLVIALKVSATGMAQLPQVGRWPTADICLPYFFRPGSIKW